MTFMGLASLLCANVGLPTGAVRGAQGTTGHNGALHDTRLTSHKATRFHLAPRGEEMGLLEKNALG